MSPVYQDISPLPSFNQEQIMPIKYQIKRLQRFYFLLDYYQFSGFKDNKT